MKRHYRTINRRWPCARTFFLMTMKSCRQAVSRSRGHSNYFPSKWQRWLRNLLGDVFVSLWFLSLPRQLLVSVEISGPPPNPLPHKKCKVVSLTSWECRKPLTSSSPERLNSRISAAAPQATILPRAAEPIACAARRVPQLLERANRRVCHLAAVPSVRVYR